MKRMLLTLALLPLLSAAASAQTSVLSIPALPGGVTAPVIPTSGAPTAPASATPQTRPSPATGATSAHTTSGPSTPRDLPTVTTLPTGRTALPGDYKVSLTGPRTVVVGHDNLWKFYLSNTGTSAIHLAYGACDVRFEVLNAAGQVIRPNPKNALCTMQLVYLDTQPGETRQVQQIRWDGKDGEGRLVPAGSYTIRAKFIAGDQFTPAATLGITVQ